MTTQKRGPGRPRSASKLTPAEKQARHRERLGRRLEEARAAEIAAEHAADEADRRADELLDIVNRFDRARLLAAVHASSEGQAHEPFDELLAEHRRLFGIWRAALTERNALYMQRREATNARFKAETAWDRAA